MLRQIDDKYCRNKTGDTYNYDRRNYSTSHVHMMLSTALTEMMNISECIMFFNTPNSVSVVDDLECIKNGKNKRGNAKVYVLLVVAKYGNAKVFSPVMNKVLLLTCVQKGTQIEILTDYGDFTERICELEESVVDKDKLLFPDALYEFFGKVTGV